MSHDNMVSASSLDENFIKKTFTLAKKGEGWTNPNPMVGAIIVKGSRVIGYGYHRRVGLPHAEIEALHNARESVKGATLYVNLEPCSHYGRTPPCVDALISSGIKRVVCSTLDPNPRVRGMGVAALRKAGIQVSVGPLKNEARRLNEAFFTFQEKHRPFIAIKFASSLDGKIATHTGDSKWITNEKARGVARKLRSQYQAIIVGITTVLHDNPHLGTRMRGKKDPTRIILDSTLRIPFTSQVLRDANVIIATTTRADAKKKKELITRGIEVIQFAGTRVPIDDLLQEMRKRDIISLFVEGGGEVLGSFIDERLVDKVYAFFSPIILGGERAITAIRGKGAQRVKDALRLSDVVQRRINDTILMTGYTHSQHV